jgi:mycofactocin precursor
MPAGLARLPNRPGNKYNRANFYPRGREITGEQHAPAPSADSILKEIIMETTVQKQECQEEPRILDEIQVEELAIDGICGVY